VKTEPSIGLPAASARSADPDAAVVGGDDRLERLVRLLARQAAAEFMRSRVARSADLI